MISKKMQDAMNAQIKNELFSAHLYMSMAAYFNSLGWDGMAAWMKKQSQEEYSHAMKFYHHLTERDGRVLLTELDKPEHEWASPLAAFQAAYAHEQFITGKINSLVDLAKAESDHAANAFLQWFVTEQVEEEASTAKVAQMLERIGNSGNGLVMLDRQLSAR